MAGLIWFWNQPAPPAGLWTFIGSASNPTTGGSLNSTTVTVTPPGSMQAGDLVVAWHSTKLGSSAPPTASIGVDGGQSWTDGGIDAISTNRCIQMWWCVYNGTWSADPRFDFDTTNQATTAFMEVHRPQPGYSVFAGTDAGHENGAAPSGPPYQVTLTGFTTSFDAVLVVASIMAVNDITWSVVTGGWTGVGPFDNVAGTDLGNMSAFKEVATTGGSTGNVTFEQTLGTGEPWLGRQQTWYQTLAADVRKRRMMMGVGL